MCNRNEILIVGMGSDILTDDGVGVEIVNFLAADQYFHDLNYKTELLFSLDFIELIMGYKTVVFIDGTIQKDQPPGHISIHSLKNFRETLHLTNLHEMKFQDCFSFWKILNYKLPEHVYVISVEVDDFLSFGSKLSPKLRKSFNENLNQVKSWIHHLIVSEYSMLV